MSTFLELVWICETIPDLSVNNWVARPTNTAQVTRRADVPGRAGFGRDQAGEEVRTGPRQGPGGGGRCGGRCAGTSAKPSVIMAV